MECTNDLPARVLHLLGAHTSVFYRDLSLVYARACHRPTSIEHRFGLVEPSGGWRLGTDLDRLGPAQPVHRFLADLGSIDLVVPYMFDTLGMTSYRSLFEDIVGIPVVGSRAEITSVAQDKLATKRVLSAAGVNVPADIDPADPVFPAIVKPATEDNSRGLSIVENIEEFEPAMAEARRFGESVVVEEYIAGRELRVAVIELDGELHVPAMIEYGVGPKNPLRKLEHKLRLGGDGAPVAQSTDSAVAAICPAPVDEPLRRRLAEMATRAHQALGCRDYSLFDLRLAAETDEPFVLEAGLFWTFGSRSIITQMLQAGGGDVDDVVATVWRNAAARRFNTDTTLTAAATAMRSS